MGIRRRAVLSIGCWFKSIPKQLRRWVTWCLKIQYPGQFKFHTSIYILQRIMFDYCLGFL
eukprot:403338843